MNEFEIILAIGALVTAYIARGLPRAWLWIAAGAASCAASSIYWNMGLPWHPAFTMFADAAVCLAIFAGAREKWELKLYVLFKASVAISVTYFFVTHILKITVSPTWLYPALLETVNALALWTIGKTAHMDRIRADGDYYGHHWLFNTRGSHNPLRKARSSPPWHKVAR
jgi:hypothetical protein